MKKNQIAIVIAALFISASAFAGGQQPTSSPSAGVAGVVGVQSIVGGTSQAGVLGGSSQSGAQSLQSATIATYQQAIIPGGNVNGAQSATIGAVGTTASQGFAFNLSTGAATGSASMSGLAEQAAAGVASTGQVGNPGSSGHGWDGYGAQPATSPFVAGGSASGSEQSVSNQSINAGTNQGAAIESVSGGNFGADVGFTTNSAPVQVPASGNTVTSQDGNGLQVTAGSIGGTFSQTSTQNGVFTSPVFDGSGNQTGTSINFGGDSNQLTTAPTIVAGHDGHGGTVIPAGITNQASGSFGAQSQIGGTISTGNQQGVNVQAPL